MTFNEFKTTDPGAGEIDLFISGGSNVAGITISTQNCTSTNFSYTIQQASTITVNSTEFTITEKIAYPSHFFLDITETPFNLSSDGIGSGECLEIGFSPFLLPIPFTYNDYNALLGNSEDIRTTSFIFDVTRTNDQIIPLNIENILSGNATPAKFVESNHTDTGLINARYNGTKTSISDYGTLPAFSAVSFKGASYGVDTTNQLICSQSSENRVIKDLLFAPNPQATVSFENLEEVPQIRFRSLGFPAPQSSTKADGTDIATGIANSELYTRLIYNTYLDIKVNDIIRIGGSNGEVMKVTGITTQTSSNTTFIVIRAYKKDVNSSNIAKTVGSTSTSFEIVLGDTIYNAESNQVFRLNDKKLWIQDTLQVFYVDDDGTLLFELETCTV
jgi:hypothetical protein